MPRGNSEVRDARRAVQNRPIVLDSLLPPQASSRGGMGSLSTHSRPHSWNSRDAAAIFDTLRPVSNAWAQVPPTILAPATRCLGGVKLFGAWILARALWRTLSYFGGNYNFYPHGEDRACGAKLLCNGVVGTVDRWLSGLASHPGAQAASTRALQTRPRAGVADCRRRGSVVWWLGEWRGGCRGSLLVWFS